MAAAKNSSRINTPTEQNKEDNSLVLYRLTQVENAVKDLTKQLAGKENITKADLLEFRTTILERFNEKNEDLQEQIDNKADKKDVNDLKGLVKAVGAAFTTIIVALVVYYLTTGRN